MRLNRSMRLAAPLALALCVAAPEARAQFGSGSSDYVLMSILVAPPALASLICDIVSVATLTNGYAYRGSAVTGTVFGGVTTLLSFLALVAGLTSSGVFEFWVPVGSVGIAMGLGSVLLGIYAITHPPPDKPGTIDGPRAPQVRAPGEVTFLPTVFAARGGFGAAGLLTVSL
jgi:hypothetical protein